VFAQFGEGRVDGALVKPVPEIESGLFPEFRLDMLSVVRIRVAVLPKSFETGDFGNECDGVAELSFKYRYGYSL
jgi:hypothetical protein